MIAYGKTAANAIATMSFLAEIYGSDNDRAGSAAVAQARDISQALAAKLLTRLSQAGLVNGSPGPGGGYCLAKQPEEIVLFDIVHLFEKMDDYVACPFGPNWCGHHDPCPLHEQIVDLKERVNEFLKTTTLAAFSENPNKSTPALEH